MLRDCLKRLRYPVKKLSMLARAGLDSFAMSLPISMLGFPLGTALSSITNLIIDA